LGDQRLLRNHEGFGPLLEDQCDPGEHAWVEQLLFIGQAGSQQHASPLGVKLRGDGDHLPGKGASRDGIDVHLQGLTELYLPGETFRNPEIDLDGIDGIEGDDGIAGAQVAAGTDVAQPEAAGEGSADDRFGPIRLGQPQGGFVQLPLGISLVPLAFGDGRSFRSVSALL
jgi:hypothetical protein